jgi:hypothetical protein
LPRKKLHHVHEWTLLLDDRMNGDLIEHYGLGHLAILFRSRAVSVSGNLGGLPIEKPVRRAQAARHMMRMTLSAKYGVS